jgi:dTMP kinase
MTTPRVPLTGNGAKGLTHKRKPLFIVFEGIDGAGKSAQVQLLALKLRADGLAVLVTAEPSNGPVGAIIRNLSSRPEVTEEERLFRDDRRDHVSNVILPAIASGTSVICDRYVYSSAAYQGARGLDPDEIVRANDFAPKPDLVFILELPVEEALGRIQTSRKTACSIFEEIENLKRVAEIYKRFRGPEIRRIDALRPLEQVSREIAELVEAFVSDREADSLWTA